MDTSPAFNLQTWLLGFLEAEGLESLFDAVETISCRRVIQLSDCLLLLEAVACIKSILNNKLGLEFIIENRHSKQYVRKLVKGKRKILSVIY